MPTVNDDVARLEVLLEDERLTDKERRAFGDMLGRLDAGMPCLTPAQRTWCDDVYRRLEKDTEEGAVNLYSAGKVPDGIRRKGEPVQKAYELMPRVLLPPGRR